jgi:hypothetical protein
MLPVASDVASPVAFQESPVSRPSSPVAFVALGEAAARVLQSLSTKVEHKDRT